MSLTIRTPTDSTDESTGATDVPASRRPGRRRATGATSVAVNLLSPWVLDELRVRRLRRRFVAGAVALVLVVAAVWGLLRVNLMRAEADLRADEAVGASLGTQIRELAPVSSFVADVTSRETLFNAMMLKQLGLGAALRQLDRALPPGASLTDVAVEVAPDPTLVALQTGQPPEPVARLCPGPDPFETVTVTACLTLRGVADSRADVAALVRALGDSGLFVEPFVNATAIADEDGTTRVEFDGTVGLAESAFTGRFAPDDSDETTSEVPR